MRAQVASCEKEKDKKGKKRLTTYRLKQCRTFKVQGVKLKRRASSGPTTDVLGAISKHGETKRDVEFIREDKDRPESLWRETRIGDVLPWEDVADEAQRLLDIHNFNASRNAPYEGHEDGEQEIGIQAYVGSKTRLPRTRGISSKGPT
jgi:hypothetical protein